MSCLMNEMNLLFLPIKVLNHINISPTTTSLSLNWKLKITPLFEQKENWLNKPAEWKLPPVRKLRR